MCILLWNILYHYPLSQSHFCWCLICSFAVFEQTSLRLLKLEYKLLSFYHATSVQHFTILISQICSLSSTKLSREYVIKYLKISVKCNKQINRKRKVWHLPEKGLNLSMHISRHKKVGKLELSMHCGENWNLIQVYFQGEINIWVSHPPFLPQLKSKRVVVLMKATAGWKFSTFFLSLGFHGRLQVFLS